MRAAIVGLIASVMLFGQTGPEAGQKIPQFTLKDQNGMARTSASIVGPKGALVVFFRSADW